MSIARVVFVIAVILGGALVVSADTTTVADTAALMSNTESADIVETEASGGSAEGLYPMSPERKAQLISYSRFVNIWRFVEFFLSVGVLCLILFTGFSAKLRQWAGVARKRFLVVWLFLVLLVTVDYLLNFPFHVYRSFVVEGQYGFVNQTFVQWLSEDLLGLLISMVIGVIPVWFLYWVISKSRRWWMWVALGAIPFTVLMIVIVPVVIAPMFNKYEPLKDKALEAEILGLAAKAGIEGSDVFQVDASKQSSKINAYVTGLFGTKRIVLYDTMIDNFDTDEIRFVMGHEMGHYLMQHIWKGLALAIVFIAFALWLTNRTIHPVINRFKRRFGFDHLGDIASLPLILLFLTILSFLFNPVFNGYSRYMERQADKYAMDISEISGDEAAVAFEKLSVFNLSDPDPHPVIEFWFYSHPALNKRIKFVQSYQPAG